MSILTLDLGTTNFKAALFDRDGSLKALQRAATPSEQPQPGWCQIDPVTFRRTITDLLRSLAKQSPGGLRDVRAVSFATQTNSFVLLDEADEPVTPIIVWTDRRAESFVDRLQPLASRADFRRTTGIHSLSCEFMAAKLLWMQEHEPHAWSRTRRLCLISDYLTLWLSGQHVSEAGAAGLLALLDIHTLKWQPEFCDDIRLPVTWLPRVVRAGTDVGALRREAAQELGLPADCRFAVGCLDQYAGAIGAANVSPGGLSETTGTVLASVQCSDRFDAQLPPAVVQGPGFADGIYFRMAFGSTSANLLEAYRNSLPDRPMFAALDELAAQVPPGADELTLQDAGKSDRFDRGRHVRAILEAVAFALAGQIEQLTAGQRPREVRCAGGAAQSRLWRQIKADVVNCPFVATTCAEPTSLGAALLAAHALGEGDVAALAARWVKTLPPVHPDPAAHQIYQTLRSRLVADS